MLEEVIPSIWAYMYSWCTPAVLFLLLNLMIGTIAVSSGALGQKHKQKPQQGNEQWQAPLARAPSVLERLKSINLYRLRSGEMSAFHPAAAAAAATTVQPSETETHHAVEQTRDEEEDEETEEEEEEEEEPRELETLDSNPDQFTDVTDHHVTRSTSDMKPASGEVPAKLARKLKKSASAKSSFAHFAAEELVEMRRPSTVKEEKSKGTQLFGDDQEVDAKADDFINRFKQQLKLQRLDSIIRYKDMINRGASQ